MSTQTSDTHPMQVHTDIHRLVHGFYAERRQDRLLGPVFEPLLEGHWDAHLARMVDFWCTALKVERRFRGDVYQRHMALADIRPEHLLRWLQLWERHCQRCLPPELAPRACHVALGVGRVMHLGWFGDLPSHQALARQVQDYEPAAAGA